MLEHVKKNPRNLRCLASNLKKGAIRMAFQTLNRDPRIRWDVVKLTTSPHLQTLLSTVSHTNGTGLKLDAPHHVFPLTPFYTSEPGADKFYT